jgi:hypothetical protein
MSCIRQPSKWDLDMKTSSLAVFACAAIVGIASLVSSVQPSKAGGLGLDWLSNKPYVDCMKGINFLSNWNRGQPQTAAQRDAAYERGRHYCNRKHGYE